MSGLPSFIRVRVHGHGRFLDLRLGRHPSESAPYLGARLLVFVLAWLEGDEPEFSPGLCRGREPVVFSRLSGAAGGTKGYDLWAVVGRAPDPGVLRRAASLAGRVWCLCYGDRAACAVAAARVRPARVRVLWLDRRFLARIAGLAVTAGEWEVSFDREIISVSGISTRIVPL